jgi:hypothetical protein
MPACGAMSAALARVNRSEVFAFSCQVSLSKASDAGAAIHEVPLPFNAMIRSYPMKTKLALSAVAAAVAVFSQGAFAQASSPTRAEVKAEAKTANKAPKGDAATGGTPTKGSTTTKDARKAETQAAAKSGNLSPGGDAMTKEGAGAPPKTSNTTKEARKAETNAAIKAGDTTPKGDAMTKEGTKKP